MTSEGTPGGSPTDDAALEEEPLQDLEPATDESADVRGGWRWSMQEEEEEELQL